MNSQDSFYSTSLSTKAHTYTYTSLITESIQDKYVTYGIQHWHPINVDNSKGPRIPHECSRQSSSHLRDNQLSQTRQAHFLVQNAPMRVQRPHRGSLVACKLLQHPLYPNCSHKLYPRPLHGILQHDLHCYAVLL